MQPLFLGVDMSNGKTNNVCKAHSGFDSRIKYCEANVTELWKKWNGMQKIIMTLLLSNLIGVIIILIKNL